MRTVFHVLLVSVVTVSLELFAVQAGRAGTAWADEKSCTVSATALDVPASTPDGSIRFHVLLDPAKGSPADQTIFPCVVPGKQWIRFPAQGFDSHPACGVIYRTGDTVTNGMPLGGIDTGCVDLETSGMLGYATIYNTHVPRRGPMNVPILGLSVGGKTWLLCHPQPKDGGGGYQPSAAGRTYTLWRNGKYEQTTELVTPVPMALNFKGLRTAQEIHYWGHYPVADLEFQTDAPLSVGLRAWSPFLPGDVVDSMLPGAVFEVHLRNPSPVAQSGTIAFSFPGPLDKEAGPRHSSGGPSRARSAARR